MKINKKLKKFCILLFFVGICSGIFAQKVITGTITDNMPEKPAWYKTSDMARIFVGEHIENITFEK